MPPRCRPHRALFTALPLTVTALLVSCGSATSDFTPWTLDDLTSEQGLSIRIPEFAVAAGRESQRCYFVRVPDLDAGRELWIERVHTAINPGSHHMNVFRVRTLVGLRPEDGEPVRIGDLEGTLVDGSDEHTFTQGTLGAHPCWDSANWADWPLVANSQRSNLQDPYTDWRLPEGVAIRLTPGETLMIQTHYVNVSEQTSPAGARVGINFHRFRGTAPPLELGTLFATQQNVRICRSKPQVTYSGTCRFPDSQERLHITAANGHFHKRGDRFRIYAWDGSSENRPDPSALFYESPTWDDPPMARDLDVVPGRGGGIWWDCQYKWREPEFGCDDVDAKDPLQHDDCCYTFGGNTDVGEHCNVFLYYYPKVGTDVFCN